MRMSRPQSSTGSLTRNVHPTVCSRLSYSARHYVTGLLVLVTALFAVSIQAQSFPVRPVRMIVTFPPGGGSDFAARVVAEKLSTLLQQQVVIDNRGGADGTLGVQLVTRTLPTGYSIALTNNGALTISVHTQKNIGYDPLKDLTPIALVASYPFIIAARPALPVKNMKDLVAYAKANPGKINFASSGTISRLAQVMFLSMAGLDMKDVPYSGAGPVMTAILGGHVDLMLASPTQSQLKTGALTGLAVTGAKRSVVLPDVPTVAESGIPGYDVSGWHAIVGPAGIPAEIVSRLNADINQVLKMPDVRKRLENAGLDVAGGTSGEFLTTMRNDINKWGKVTQLMKN